MFILIPKQGSVEVQQTLSEGWRAGQVQEGRAGAVYNDVWLCSTGFPVYIVF